MAFSQSQNKFKAIVDKLLDRSTFVQNQKKITHRRGLQSAAACISRDIC
jgi:hypothetical protein